MGLFNFLFGKKTKKTKADEVIETMDNAIIFSAEKWKYYSEKLHFKDSVSLREKIFGFVPLATEGLKNNFSALQAAPDAVYMLIIAKGVELSGTHSKVEIESALGATLP